MEDEFGVAYQQTADEKDLEYAFFGIFDGHGGREAALFAKVGRGNKFHLTLTSFPRLTKNVLMTHVLICFCAGALDGLHREAKGFLGGGRRFRIESDP